MTIRDRVKFTRYLGRGLGNFRLKKLSLPIFSQKCLFTPKFIQNISSIAYFVERNIMMFFVCFKRNKALSFYSTKDDKETTVIYIYIYILCKIFYATARVLGRWLTPIFPVLFLIHHFSLLSTQIFLTSKRRKI